MVNEISVWLLHQNEGLIYTGLFLMLLGGAIGLPIPEDIPLLLSGILAQQGRCSFHVVVTIAYVGILVGDLIIFSLGRRFGPALYRWSSFRRIITPERAERIHRRLTKHSLWMIFLARHLFYLRTATFLTCGLFHMSLRRFLFADAIAALVSTPLMITLGFEIAENSPLLLRIVSQMRLTASAIGICVLLLAIVLYQRKRRKSQ